MAIFLIGLLLLVGTHALGLLWPGLRTDMVARFGKLAWRVVHSTLSLAGFVLTVWGWVLYRPEAAQVFVPPTWGRHVTFLLVLIAFIFAFAAFLPKGYIKKWVVHPFVASVGIWAFGHLLANGDMAGLLLFGAFLLYALIGWLALRQKTVVATPQSSVVSPMWDAVAVGSGLVVYLLTLFWLHAWLIGVSPLG